MMRRLRGPIAAGAAAIVTILLVFAVASPASAAHLDVSSTGIVTDTQAVCTTATIATTAPAASATSTQVRVTNLPASCAGRSLKVSVIGTNNQIIATGTRAVTVTGTNLVTVTSYNTANVARVATFLNTWWVKNNWTAPAQPAAATCQPTNESGTVVSGTCTVTRVTIADSWGAPGSRAANASFSAVSSTGWFRITFNFSQAPFPGWNPRTISGNLTLPPVTTCSALPLVTVRGPSWSNSQSPAHSYYFGFSEANGNICP